MFCGSIHQCLCSCCTKRNCMLHWKLHCVIEHHMEIEERQIKIDLTNRNWHNNLSHDFISSASSSSWKCPHMRTRLRLLPVVLWCGRVPLGFLDAGEGHGLVAILDRGFYFSHGGFHHTGEIPAGSGEALGFSAWFCLLEHVGLDPLGVIPRTFVRCAPLRSRRGRVHEEGSNATYLKQGGRRGI